MRLSRTSRHGAVVPTVAVCLIGLMGFVALAVDIGLMVIARSQAQNAADIAALAGARTLDGKTSNNNTTAAMAEAREAAQSNYILNGQIAAGQVAGVQAGVYRYDGSAQRFQPCSTARPAVPKRTGRCRSRSSANSLPCSPRCSAFSR